MVLIDHLLDVPGPALRDAPQVDERAARRTLRLQIAKLERDLADAVIAGFPQVAAKAAAAPVAAGPRLLTLGDLETVRDDLAERLRRARQAVAERGAVEAEARALLERMIAEPKAYKWVRIRGAAIGAPGVCAYQVRPRLGLVGMLMGWWEVKVSSGCPLATGHQGRGRAPGAADGVRPSAWRHPPP